MKKLILISFLTLDGVMQAPGGSREDIEGDFKYGGWQMPYMDDIGEESMPEGLYAASALLIGRKTYDIFARYWPTEGKDLERWGPFMNNTTKYVASRTLKKTEWQNSHLLKGKVGKAVAQLKSEPGNNIYMFGSGDLCQTLMRENLIDEYYLMIHPLALGEGKRLFRTDGPKREFELLKSRTTKSGILIVTYAPRTGIFHLN